MVTFGCGQPFLHISSTPNSVHDFMGQQDWHGLQNARFIRRNLSRWRWALGLADAVKVDHKKHINILFFQETFRNMVTSNGSRVIECRFLTHRCRSRSWLLSNLPRPPSELSPTTASLRTPSATLARLMSHISATPARPVPSMPEFWRLVSVAKSDHQKMLLI